MTQKKKGFISRLLRFLNLLLIFTTLVTLLAPYVKPSSFFPFIFLGMGFPILVFLNFIFVFYWLIRKKWYWVFSLVCLVISWDAISTFLGHPFHSTPEMEKGKVIKVMTFNVGSGKSSKGHNKERFFNFIKENEADIICFQEMMIPPKQSFPLKEIYPYEAIVGYRKIYSKYPIKSPHSFKNINRGSYTGGHRLDVQIGEKTIRLYNFHLQSNQITRKVDKLSKNTKIKNIDDKQTWIQTKNILSSVKRAAYIREQQVEKLQKDIEKSPYPVIVCGDFNDPPLSYTYKTLTKKLDDTFVKAGTGIGFTYKGNLPFLKIDYTLVSPEIKVISSEVLSCDVSDHNPVMTTLFIPSK